MKKIIYLILWVGIPICGFSQETSLHSISGTVLTATESSPLPGATVHLKGTNKGTNTNENGQFTLAVTGNKVVLTVSSLGYRTLDTTLYLPLRDPVIITLMQDAGMLDVAVAKGYYKTTKAFNTGSVSTVKSEILARQPVGDPLMALQGRVPGLYISQSSGVPGASLNVLLRGRNSIASGTDPLYIIDGVPFPSETLTTVNGAGIAISPLSSISIDNIERIDVLTDADATAIYGSRGANGVILITTKKGKAGDTELSIDFNKGFGRITNGYDLMNTEEYLEMRREAFVNDGIKPGPNHYDVNGAWETDRFTDWERELIGGTAQLMNARASLTGGNAHTQFRISGGYRKESTVFPGDYRNRKISLQSSVNHQSANNKFSSVFFINYVNDNNLMPLFDFTQRIVTPPNAPAIYNVDGSLNWANSTWTNPMAALYQTSTSVTENINGALTLGFDLFPWLNVNTRLGYNNIDLETTNLNPAIAKNPNEAIVDETRRHTFGRNGIRSWIAEPGINFHKSFKSSRVEGIIGATFQRKDQYGIRLNGTGFLSDALIENLEAANNIRVDRTIFSQYRYSALYARLGYTFMNRYVANLTGRRDGSSRFGPGKQFGNFGAVGLAWIFSKERVVKNTFSFLSFGKLRFSYGTTGNDQLGDYQYLSTYEPNSATYQGVAGLNPVQHTNPDFAWELVKKLEVGLELKAFDNRIALDVNWYRHRTRNQLVGYPLPEMTGFNTVQANLPAVVQNSGLEFRLSMDILQQQQFKWLLTGNLSIPRNKLLSYPNIESSSYANRYVVGRPLTLSPRYHFAGLNSTNGIFEFDDINQDGSITAAYDRHLVFTGRKFFGGINNDFSFKGFQINLFIQFVSQRGFSRRPIGIPGLAGSSQGNQPRRFMQRWRQPGDEARYQKATQLYGDALKAFLLFLDSDALISDASFVRLKNIAVSWRIPDKIAKKVNLERLKVYVQAQNLLTITGYEGGDPEIHSTSSMVLPPLRMITIGTQLSF